MMIACPTNLLASEIGGTSVTFPMDSLARNLTDQILSSGTTWKREAGDIVLLLLTGDLLADLPLALTFILRFLDSNCRMESVQVVQTLHRVIMILR